MNPQITLVYTAPANFDELVQRFGESLQLRMVAGGDKPVVVKKLHVPDDKIDDNVSHIKDYLKEL